MALNDMLGYQVLIIDSDSKIQEMLREALQNEGYRVISAYEAQKGVEAINLHPDIILLSDTIAGLDTGKLYREIRKLTIAPLIVISSRPEDAYLLLAFEMGANDYIRKPFSTIEVRARIKNLLGRFDNPQVHTPVKHVKVRGLEIDKDEYSIMVSGRSIPTGWKELEILWMLASNPGKAISREYLLQLIQREESNSDIRCIDNHIKRIRSKLYSEGCGWDIQSVRGIGYRFIVVE